MNSKTKRIAVGFVIVALLAMLAVPVFAEEEIPEEPVVGEPVVAEEVAVDESPVDEPVVEEEVAAPVESEVAPEEDEPAPEEELLEADAFMMADSEQVIEMEAFGVMAAGGPPAAEPPVTYTGQGFNADGTLKTEYCGDLADTGQDKAFVIGPGGGYLLWILTANGATSAQITGPWGTVNMIQAGGGGAFHKATNYYPLATLLAHPVTATWEGEAKGNVQLVVSHGCPEREEQWCSPGYWRQEHHLDSWPASISPTQLYNVLFDPDVAPSKLAQKAGATTNPTLWQVLQSPQWYGGEAFNKVGDLLSAAHPDVNFLGNRVEDSCPLD